MIKALGIILATYFALSISAFAETIRVISGEHADFSRIVVQLPVGTEWSFGKSGEGYELRPNKKNLDFDASRVFDRIPKNRIASVYQVGASLMLLTNEGNHADAFELRAGRVVIDIKDGAPKPGSTFESALPIVEKDVEVASNDMAVTIETSSNGSETMATSEGEKQTVQQVAPETSTFPIIFNADVNNIATDAGVESLSIDASKDTRATAAEQRAENLRNQLLEQISRAVSQGLLTPDAPQAEEALKVASEHLEQTSEEQEVSISEDIIETQPDTPKTHINIQTSVDKVAKNAISKSAQTDPSGNICITNDAVAIEEWGQPQEEGLQIGSFRSKAIQEFDVADPQGVNALAKYYIYLTFGAEAKSALKNFGIVPADQDLLFAMAEIMDNGHVEGTNVLTQHLQCDGDIAFWALASLPSFDADTPYNHRASLATFSDLPLHIRRWLGPKIAEKYLDAGDPARAKLYQNAISRAGGEHGDAYDLLNAELMISENEHDVANEELNTIVNNDGPVAPNALIKLVDAAELSNRSVGIENVENAEALLVEYRDDPLAPELFRAAVRGRLLEGDAMRAIALLEESPQALNLTEEKIYALWSAAFESLTENTEDFEFTKYVMAHLEQIKTEKASPESKIEIAVRLAKLGFSEVAYSIVRTESSNSPKLRLLKAQNAMAKNSFEEVIDILASDDTPTAIILRAKAYFKLGDPGTAATLLAQNGIKADLESYELLAENWQNLSKSDEKSYANFAQGIQKPSPEDQLRPNEIPSLELAQGLINQSQSARSAFSELLSSGIDNQGTQ